MDQVFAALGDPTRRAVLERLLDQGPATATALAPSFPVSRQAVARHLGVLHDVGLVGTTRVGREVRYEAQTQPLLDAATWLARAGARWDDRLAKLKGQLDG